MNPQKERTTRASLQREALEPHRGVNIRKILDISSIGNFGLGSIFLDIFEITDNGGDGICQKPLEGKGKKRYFILRLLQNRNIGT